MSTAPATDFRSVDERSVRIVVPSLVSTQIDELERLWKAPEAYLYTEHVDIQAEIEKQRIETLRKNANLWGLVSLFFLIAMIVCIAKKVPYEPSAALLACSLGLLVVFSMKLGDAKR